MNIFALAGEASPGKPLMPKKHVSKTTPSLTDDQLAALQALMPHAFTEGKIDPENQTPRLFDYPNYPTTSIQSIMPRAASQRLVFL
jgi:hypothetical protein